jgi:hypothetical protein
MANTVIQFKQSFINAAPISLNVGEPAYSFVSNTLFIGTPGNNGFVKIGGLSEVLRLDEAFHAANSGFIKTNSAFSHANSAFANANGAFAAANGAYIQANSGFIKTNAAFDHANAAYTSQNASGQYANGAYAHANAAYANANGAFAAANGAYIQANAVFSNANSYIIYNDGVNVRQNNNIIVALDSANAAHSNSNGAFAAANAAYIQANSAFIKTNSAFGHANAAYQSQNATGQYANSAFIKTNSAFGHANSSFGHANAAFIRANNSLSANVGGTVTGDVTISGNLTVIGNTTYVNSSQTLIADNILTLNAAINQASAPVLNAGIEIDRGIDANVYVLWNETIDKWTVTNDGTNYYGIASDAAEAYANSGFIQANAAFVHANSGYQSQNATGQYANSAFIKTNSAFGHANSGFIHANSGFIHANSAYNSQNATGQYANAAFIRANNSLNANVGGNVTGEVVIIGNLTSNTLTTTGSNGSISGANAIFTNYIFAANGNVDLYLYSSNAYANANGGFAKANAAFANANGAFAAANLAFNQANSAFIQSNSAYAQANAAYTSQNATGQYANAAFIWANAAYNQANTDKANLVNSGYTAQLYSNGVFGLPGNLLFQPSKGRITNEGDGVLAITANGQSGNTGLVLDNAGQGILYGKTGVLIQTNEGLFDSAPKNFTFGADGTFTFPDNTVQNTSPVATSYYANSAFANANAAFASANAAFANANGAFASANAAFANANGAFAAANAAYNQANSAFIQSNSAFVHANAAYESQNATGQYANAAFVRANNSLDANNGGTVTGNVTVTQNLFVLRDTTVSGNLYVLGNTFSINAGSLVSNDTLFILGTGNYTADVLDIGFASHYNDGTNAHTGLIRDSGTKEWQLFKGYTPEILANNNIDINHPSFQIDTLNANLHATYVLTKNIDLLPYANSIYDKANAAFNSANSGFIQANAAFVHANSGYQSQNATGQYANSAFIQANSAYQSQNATGQYANSAFVQANAAFNHANASFAAANNVFPQIQPAFNTANAAFIRANNSLNANAGGTVTGNVVVIGNVVADAFQTSGPAGDITGANAIFANYIFGANGSIDLTIYANNAYANANAGFAKANGAYNHANAAFLQANTPSDVANSAAIYANGAFLQANTPSYVANSAASYANSAFATANSASVYANGAFTAANVADSKAVASGNYANAAFTRANNSLNANNGGSVSGTILSTANVRADYVVANTGFASGAGLSKLSLSDIGIVAIDVASQQFKFGAAGIESNPGIYGGTFGGNKLSLNNETNLRSERYDVVKIQTGTDGTTVNEWVFANNSLTAPGGITANGFTAGGINVVPTLTSSFNTANSAFIHANAAFLAANNATDTYVRNHANAAFIRANNSLNANVGGQITGDVTITGNLVIIGNTVYANTQTVLIADNIITLNAAIDQTSAPTSNAGIEVDRGNQPNVSIIWNETTDKWTFTNDGTTYSDLGSGSGSAGDYANGAFIQANAAFAVANAANAAAANGGSVVVTFATTPPATANANGHIWIDADDGTEYMYFKDGDGFQWVEFGPTSSNVTSNTFITANIASSYGQANAAFNMANAASQHANAGFEIANNAASLANSGFSVANGAAFSANTSTVTSSRLSSNLKLNIIQVLESANIYPTAIGGNVNIDIGNNTSYFFSANTTANVTFNLRGNTTTTFDTTVAIGQTASVAIALKQGDTKYKANVYIDGVLQTPYWLGNSSPGYATSQPQSIDVYTYTVFKTATSTYSILAANSNFGLAQGQPGQG